MAPNSIIYSTEGRYSSMVNTILTNNSPSCDLWEKSSKIKGGKDGKLKEDSKFAFFFKFA